MSRSGVPDLVVQTRSALLDALDALVDHLGAVVLIGAQAVYLHTSGARLALAESTKDSDIALDPRVLGGDPLIEEAMGRAGFVPNPVGSQPGAWVNAAGIPVDLMVPESLAGPGGRRGARIPPHSRRATRRAVGLEAAVVDRAPLEIAALADGDDRRRTVAVAGPTALLIAKLHKLHDRRTENPDRLADKDAHDVYRLFVAVETETFAEGVERLRADPLSRSVTERALEHLQELFAAGPDALGCVMAGAAEQTIGDPQGVAASVNALATDLRQRLKL